MKNQVSCIIPAYNEGDRILNVLNAVKNHSLIKEILVINNNSKDNTKQVVNSFIKSNKLKNLKLFDANEHQGKAYAMYYGINKAKGNTILFLDADLQNLNPENITNLVQPIINNEVDMTLGHRGDVHFFFKPFKFDPWGGERAIKKQLFLEMPNYSHSKYGIESLINNFLIKAKKRIQVIPILNVTNTRKGKKSNYLGGIYEDYKMIKQIFLIMQFKTFIRDTFYIQKMQKLPY